MKRRPKRCSLPVNGSRKEWITSSCKLKLNATELKQVSTQKLLGVTIDQKLSFDDHIDELCNKFCQRIAVLSKIKWLVLPLEQRKAFYNAMIKQTMLYVSNVWSACSIGNLQRVFRLQRRRCARIILDANTQANSYELLTRLDWFPLHLEVKVNICVQVHKRINVRSPGYMSDLLDPVYMEWGTLV